MIIVNIYCGLQMSDIIFSALNTPTHLILTIAYEGGTNGDNSLLRQVLERTE